MSLPVVLLQANLSRASGQLKKRIHSRVLGNQLQDSRAGGQVSGVAFGHDHSLSDAFDHTSIAYVYLFRSRLFWDVGMGQGIGIHSIYAILCGILGLFHDLGILLQGTHSR